MQRDFSQLSDDEVERLYDAGQLTNEELDRGAARRIPPEELAAIEAFAYGLARLFTTPIHQLVAEASADKVTHSVPQGTVAAGEAPMPSYSEIAAHAIRRLQHRSPSPVYGYRSVGTHQKVYLFQSLEDAGSWLAAVVASQAFDYATVFLATDLSHPVPGMEAFGHTDTTAPPVSGTAVGGVLPFLLGLPVGALGGYFLRRWQEANPGHAFPPLPAVFNPAKPSGPAEPVARVQTKATSGSWYDLEPIVGGWVDLEEPAGAFSAGGYTIGSWVDLVGQQPGQPLTASTARHGHPAPHPVRSREWSRTRALIQSAIREVSQAAHSIPAVAYVWSLDPPGDAPSPSVSLEGTTGIMSFNSADEALAYMRERIQTPHVALALFNHESPHWPNPTSWTKSDDPAYVPYIDQQIANQRVQVSGAYVGSAVDDVRVRATALAHRHAGDIVGVIHTTHDGLWHTLALRNADDADDWLGISTQDPGSYTYAAYYDKNDVQWPHPVNEKIGGTRAVPRRGSLGRRDVATWGS